MIFFDSLPDEHARIGPDRRRIAVGLRLKRSGGHMRAQQFVYFRRKTAQKFLTGRIVVLGNDHRVIRRNDGRADVGNGGQEVEQFLVIAGALAVDNRLNDRFLSGFKQIIHLPVDRVAHAVGKENKKNSTRKTIIIKIRTITCWVRDSLRNFP